MHTIYILVIIVVGIGFFIRSFLNKLTDYRVCFVSSYFLRKNKNICPGGIFFLDLNFFEYYLNI